MRSGAALSTERESEVAETEASAERGLLGARVVLERLQRRDIDDQAAVLAARAIRAVRVPPAARRHRHFVCRGAADGGRRVLGLRDEHDSRGGELVRQVVGRSSIRVVLGRGKHDLRGGRDLGLQTVLERSSRHRLKDAERERAQEGNAKKSHAHVAECILLFELDVQAYGGNSQIGNGSRSE